MHVNQPFRLTVQVGRGVEAGLPLLLQDNAGSYVYGPGGMLLACLPALVYDIRARAEGEYSA